MKLELKHLAGYLPYGLRAFDYLNQQVKIIGLKNETYFIEGGNIYAYGDIKDCKPILRPLLDLTKEIEVNGEKFIPIEELVKISDSDYASKIELKNLDVVYGMRYFDNNGLEFVFNYSSETKSFASFERVSRKTLRMALRCS